MRKIKLFFYLLASTILIFNNLSYTKILANTKPSKEEILKHWAPTIYQDIRHDTVKAGFITLRTYVAGGDMITKVNFDGDWNAGNNHNSLKEKYSDKLPAYVYGSYVESDSHYFLGYHIYHATDDAVIKQDRHENDMEDIYLCIKKTNTNNYGNLITMITQYHGNYAKYQNKDILYDGSHPKIYISSNGDVINSQLDKNAKGHAIFAYNKNYNKYVGNDAIIYKVGNTADTPNNYEGVFEKKYNYKLLSIDELWNRRFDINSNKGATTTFESYYAFNSEDERSGANTPWLKKQFNDPATYFAENGAKDINKHYIDNKYQLKYDGNNIIKNVKNNKVLEVVSASKENNANIAVYPKKTADFNNQLWEFTYLGNNHFVLKNKHSNKVLDVAGNSKDNAANIIQYDLNWTENQIFKKVEKAKGQWMFINIASGKAVDLNVHTDNVQQYAAGTANKTNQLWTIKK